MISDPLRVLAAARIAHADLIEIDKQLSTDRALDVQWMLLIKLALVSVATLDDLEGAIRPICVGHPQVSAEFKNISKQFRFAKYMRNILVGHTNPNLVAKAIEWRPELRALLAENDAKADILVNLFILETALNTYVDDNEKHFVFDTESDLLYPPDWTRFAAGQTKFNRIRKPGGRRN